MSFFIVLFWKSVESNRPSRRFRHSVIVLLHATRLLFRYCCSSYWELSCRWRTWWLWRLSREACVRITHKNDILVAVVLDARLYNVSARTGWPGVGEQWLGEIPSLICNFSLSGALRSTNVWADRLRDILCLLLGCEATNILLLLLRSQLYILGSPFLGEIFAYVTVFQSNHWGSHIPSSWMVYAGCVFVVGNHLSRTGMSRSFESVRWNAWVHRLHLELYFHPKALLGNGVRTHINSKGKNPLYRKKILPRRGSNPRHCIKQNSELNTLPTSYSAPPPPPSPQELVRVLPFMETRVCLDTVNVF